ncbi:glutathione hydrolase 1-like [Aristolochia californica]|uniref:glutathione hydrolase 1-like n=1 Tax=Aristolochia californica TaxID=171875 RepID=UPI0035D88E94
MEALPASPLLCLAIAFILLLVPGKVSAQSASHRREVITAKQGAVATDDGRCSLIGTNVLRDGGNAVDASVAAALCLGVVSPASSGIGGGAFMLIRLANGEAHALDCRETAPLKTSQNMFANDASSKSSGPLSVAVPAELAGLYEAWKQHGKLPWKRLVRPAIVLARKGFEISPYLHMQMVKTELGILKDKGLSEIFTSNRSLLQVGDICHNKKLAQTLEAISQYGAKALYNGRIGFSLVRDIQKAGGILTMEDLRIYEVKLRKPLIAEVMGHEILGMPPPSAGGAGMILILNILAKYGVPHAISGSLGLHREIEAVKHMIAVRMNLGDPDFVNVSEVLSDMLSTKFAEELKATIYDNMTFNSNIYGGRWNQINDHGTSHLCIVDGDRNSVSMTSTVNSYFGAQFLSPRTGILLNNEMDDFSIPANNSAGFQPPAPANLITPSKRPLSSMTPTIVLKDGQLKAVVGASGGAMIISGVTEVFLNHFGKGMDPLSSIMAPRVYHQLIPNVVLYENWTTVTGDHFELPAEMRKSLKKKGHVLKDIAGGTICQFLVLNLENCNVTSGVRHGEIVAVSDPRKGGFPAGL